VDDVEAMRQALGLAAAVRPFTSPNPWVGCVVEHPDGRIAVGATAPPGGPHAEAMALAATGGRAEGATLWCTLEPCDHRGRTPACSEAIVAAGVRRVVVAVEDPDRKVAGRGLRRLREAGVEVDVGVLADEARAALAPYLHHRTTGRPWVVLKLAASLDGRTAAPDASSRWITGPEARADAHRLRAESDAVLVGAGTVAADDPSLTVRLDPPVPAVPELAGVVPAGWRQPQRVVLGTAPPAAKVRPALELSGPLPAVLDELGRRDVVQLMVEGGASVAGAFHRAGLVDRYVLYLAPVLLGGDDGRPVLAGAGAPTMADAWRGRVVDVARVGADVRIDLARDPCAPRSGSPARP
jgi:diaminohydroxyphosphoribosylaminopyrimidine deaminase/5-amino-6-(5-phosphoribosylamino)uracil reductase